MNKSTRLEILADIIPEQFPESNYYNHEGKGLPFYQGKKEFGEVLLAEPTVWTESITRESLKGDILMSVRAPVGSVNINPFERICIGRGLTAIRCYEEGLKDWLFYYLKTNEAIISGHDGATFSSISRDEINAIIIEVPPETLQNQFSDYVNATDKLKFKCLKERLDN